MVDRFPAPARADSPPAMPEKPMRFKKLEVVARGGIEPPTRGFSVRRRAGLGVTNRKSGNAVSRGRPKCPLDRAYTEPAGHRPTETGGRVKGVKELPASRPNFFRTGR